MKQLLSRMLRTHDSQLEEIMRSTPEPVPPEGLRERLITEALAASEDAPAGQVRSRAWLAWAVPATVAAIILVIVLGVASQRHQPGKPPVIVQEAPAQSPITPPVVKHEEAPEPAPDPVVQEHKAEPPQPHPKVRRKTYPRPRREQYVAENKPEVEELTPVIHTEAPQMQVTVSRAREGGGYARASAWALDEAGNPMKTEWTIVDDPGSGEPVEELSVTDADGRRQSITVAASVSNKRGEQLWNDSSDL